MEITRTGQGNQLKTLIYQQELDHIAGWVQEYPDLETGGDLFGFWTHSGFPVVQFVLGPGKNSRHNPTSFYQDKEYLVTVGKILRQKYGLQHIGEWHSHHQMGLAQPSRGDEQTVFNALEKYKFPEFLLCIANLHPETGILGIGSKYIVNVGCFSFTPSSLGYKTGSWVVLPDQSPIRQGLSRGDNLSLLTTCRPNKNWKVDQTTLEDQLFISTEPIEISKDMWYSTQEGNALLKAIYDGLTSSYSKCEMFRTQWEEIYFTFEQNPNYGYVPDKWRVDIPHNFPQSSPKIKLNERSPSEIKDWNGEFQIVEQIKACIQRYYNGEWRK